MSLNKYLIWAASADDGLVVDDPEEFVPFLEEDGVLLFPLLSKGPRENLILHLFFIFLYIIGQVAELKAHTHRGKCKTTSPTTTNTHVST